MKIQTGHGMITLTALLAIYSISMVTSLPGLAISPILGDLKNIFKNASDLELQMLESLPSFIIVPFILLAGRLSLKINKKRILIIGLSIFFGCSVIYPFSNSLWLLLVVSALLGVGAGMIIPFSTGLIADNVTGPANWESPRRSPISHWFSPPFLLAFSLTSTGITHSSCTACRGSRCCSLLN